MRLAIFYKSVTARHNLIISMILLGFLAGCVSGSVPVDMDLNPESLRSAVAQIQTIPATPTSIMELPVILSTEPVHLQPRLIPTNSPVPKPQPTPTEIPPPIFSDVKFYTGIEPVAYLSNTCQYIYDRWKPDSSQPGTIVVPIMYHGIRREGGTVTDNITVTEGYFHKTMNHAYELGYETITIAEFIDFLNENKRIPPRSLLLIIDDRRLGTVKEHFLPVLEDYDWTLVMAYITGVMNAQEWADAKNVLATGLVEMEGHGYLHNGATYITEFTTEETMIQEIYNPIKAFLENLGYRPRAFIWPGGNFNEKAVTIAREAGYEIGFTVHSRGPVMFNWIPQGQVERTIGDPLLMLPRYWSTKAFDSLDDAATIGENARAYAFNQREEEFAWYHMNCKAYPPLDFPQP